MIRGIAVCLSLLALLVAGCSAAKEQDRSLPVSVPETESVRAIAEPLIEEPADEALVQDVQPEPPNIPAAEQAEEPAQEPVAEPVESSDPTATPEPEEPSLNPVPGSCLILEEKFCDNGTVVRIFGKPMLAFRLPPGTLLFAPWSEDVRFSATSAINPKLTTFSMLLDANSNQVAEPEDIEFVVHGDLDILLGTIEQGGVWEQNGQIQVSDYFTVAQGAPIARMRDTGATTLRGNHNLVVFVVAYDSAGGAAISQQLTQELLSATSN